VTSGWVDLVAAWWDGSLPCDCYEVHASHQFCFLTELTYQPPAVWVTSISKIGSVGEAPPGGPNVHTIGEKDVLHPRSMALPLEYGFEKSVVTAEGVATVKAAARFPDAQLETRAVAAASAPGFSPLGIGVVVDVVVART